MNKKNVLLVGVLFLLPLFGILLFAAPKVSAATITVDITAHEDSEPLAGAGCSYYEAMQAANTNAAYGGCPAGDDGEDTINLPAGTYDTSSTFGSFEDSIRIIGDPAGGTYLEGRPVAFYPNQAEQYLIQDVTIQNGFGAGIAASINAHDTEITIRRVTIRNAAYHGIDYYKYAGTTGTITIEDSLIENSEADGIANDECVQGGTMNITNTTIRNNGGYGLYNSCGHMNVQSSTISNNAAGGIYSRHLLDLTNVTVHDNGGHGIELRILDWWSDDLVAEAHLANVTIADNAGAGIYGGSDNTENDEYDEFTIYNTLIANNTGGSCAFEENFTTNYPASGNHNMATDGTCDELMSESDSVTQVSNAFLADSLADNGGGTSIGSGGLGGNVLTLALLEGSPAIDAGNDDYCPAVDERNMNRPDGNACDIGAYESPFTLASSTPSTGAEEDDEALLADTGQSETLFIVIAGALVLAASFGIVKTRQY